MYDSANAGGRKKRWAAAVGLLAAGAIGGGVLASALTASASSDTSTASAGTVSSPSGHARTPGPGGAQPVRPDEKSVPSTTAATLRAAALKAVPGGTVYRIETDAGDGVYEVHMKKADGSLVTVKFDKNLKVTKVESGMGAGDPAPAGQGAPGAAE
ncbi:MAG TPA: hypothetical protein VE979_08620 [Streptosporangiaceae bacterium]|nr:hypothetical protein [Streptosporangiaceae bacterium]